ncbi:MAG: nucleoside triphosphate pyrophosphohydrolase [bacterium]
MKKGVKSVKNFNDLLKVISQLRSRKGCPWDRAQTHSSLKPYLLEETYETLDTIDRLSKKGGYQDLKEELGDLLLQILLHAEIARENGKFYIGDVISSIGNKMIRRHPHVFSSKQAKSIDQIWSSWEEIKQTEKSTYSILDSIPKALPALARADKIQKKVRRVGFDWKDLRGPLEKLDEEIRELYQLLKVNRKTKKFSRKYNKNIRSKIKEELGDILLSVVNISRRLEIDAEDALRYSTDKFIKRFNFIEKTAKIINKPLKKMSLSEMDKLWEKAKLKKL